MTDVFTRDSAYASKEYSASLAREIFDSCKRVVCVIVSDHLSECDEGGFVKQGGYQDSHRFVYINTTHIGVSPIQPCSRFAFWVWPCDEDAPIWSEAMRALRAAEVVEVLAHGDCE